MGAMRHSETASTGSPWSRPSSMSWAINSWMQQASSRSMWKRWKTEDLAIGTIKNRMADLRWWSEKIGKQNVLARDNDHYGIGKRQYVTNVSKARELMAVELAKVTDTYTQMSLRLQAAFGLRRAESIKICPDWADRGDRLALKASWAKGGRAREIPVRSDEQRLVIDAAKALAGRGSLMCE